MTAAHCEAKLHGFRKTQDGIVVSFVLHPQDWPQQLALDPLGTRYMLAVAQIGDDEQQVSRANQAPSAAVVERAENRDVGDGLEGIHTVVADESKIRETSEGVRDAKARYAAKTDQEKAAVRAVLLCRDVRFQDWLYALSPAYRRQRLSDAPAEECAALWMRGECGIASRREIATDYDAYGRFVALENRYKIATGQMAEERG